MAGELLRIWRYRMDEGDAYELPPYRDSIMANFVDRDKPKPADIELISEFILRNGRRLFSSIADEKISEKGKRDTGMTL